MLRVGSLFAGIGGFCRAYLAEGFRVVWANELDSFAATTYRANYHDVHLYEKSIEDLSVIHDALQPVDVLTAGFPCQPFSVAGSQKGFDDPRGKLFFEIVRLLKEFGPRRPKIVVLENVPGLLSHAKGATFSKMVNSLQSAGYWFMPPSCYEILNTMKLTDIPQSRERLFMVALSWDYFNEFNFQFPMPQGVATRPVRDFLALNERAEDSLYFDPESRWGKLFEESMREGNPDGVYQLRRYYVRENKSDAVFTLTANMGEGGHNVPTIKDDWGIRKLSPEECARLQGFEKEEFIFPAEISRSQRYRQVGNAVTVPLVRLLARECKRILN
ncbi:DNA (cytosine-5-)-methyltransferase [Kerstersia gyiorum]|uniref:DNA (cytosine-5-)-methyltransferase n=1 Tax=Kerstersia gyiorum TaxID=206506 RepID=UPI00142FC05D|nr:DNA (cytosine-5-)-methyltransferase [Kerstersia gyiorum]